MDSLLWYHYVVGAVLIISSIIIVFLVMRQQGHQQGLSGAIAGAADSFFGKNKGRTMEAQLSKFTKIAGSIFFVLALVSALLVLFVS